jgi:hypothetical protein
VHSMNLFPQFSSLHAAKVFCQSFSTCPSIPFVVFLLPINHPHVCLPERILKRVKLFLGKMRNFKPIRPRDVSSIRPSVFLP